MTMSPDSTFERHLSVEELAELVSRDAMIGTSVARASEAAR